MLVNVHGVLGARGRLGISLIKAVEVVAGLEEAGEGEPAAGTGVRFGATAVEGEGDGGLLFSGAGTVLVAVLGDDMGATAGVSGDEVTCSVVAGVAVGGAGCDEDASG